MTNEITRFNWSKAEGLKFLSLIREHPQIWDHSSPHFRNQFQRELALDTISFEMGITNDMVKRKIHTMRSQYLSEVKKMKENKRRKPVWPLFNAAKFFYENNKNETSKENHQESNDEEEYIVGNSFDEDCNSQSTVAEENCVVKDEIETEQENVDEVVEETRFTWTETKTLKLLELYRQYPFLYNNKLDDHANTQKRHAALKEIAQQMETNVRTIRNKINNLRSTFVAVVKKMQKRNLKKSTWPFYNKVKFFYTGDMNSPRTSNKFSSDVDNSSDDYNDETVEYLIEEDIVDENERVAADNQSEHKLKISDSFKPTTCIACEERDEFTIFGETVATELRLTKGYRDIHKLLKQQILEALQEAKESIPDYIS